jgi:hypothetical protein
MSFRSDTARIRRQLQRQGIATQLPRCPTCGSQIALVLFAKHTAQCLRDCASQAIFAIDLEMARLYSTEPRNPEHAACMEASSEWLRQERFERFNELVGLDSLGRGHIVVEDKPCSCGNPECTRYDTAF